MRWGEVVWSLVGWLAGWWLLARSPRLAACPPAPTGSDGVLPVAVVIPARDEATTLPALLAGLAAQRPRPTEAVLVDDESTDGTADVARRLGPPWLRVVAAPPRPDGWNGKQWACATGAAATSAPVLVFLDADVEPAPDALALVAGAVAAQPAGQGGDGERRGGLVSVQPHHRTERAYEALSAFPNLVSLMAVDAFAPFVARRGPTGAFGPCLALWREDYDQLGGHGAVRAAPMEDIALARLVVADGRPVTLLVGGDRVAFRMYPAGPRSWWDGWVKGLGVGVARVRLRPLVLLVAWLSACAGVPPALVDAVVDAGRDDPSLRLVAAMTAYVLFALQVGVLLRRIGRFPWWTSAVYFVPFVAFVTVFLRSAVVVLAGRDVRWKGRPVATGRSGAGRDR